MLGRTIKLFLDAFSAAAALFAGALLLALLYQKPLEHIDVWLSPSRFLIFSLTTVALTLLLALDRMPWRFTSFDDLIRIGAISVTSTLMLLAMSFLTDRGMAMPRALPIFSMFFLIMFMGGTRLVSRLMWKFHLREDPAWRLIGRASTAPADALLVGNVLSVVAFLNANRTPGASEWRFAGALVAGAEWNRARLRGVPVLGTPDQIEDVVTALRRKGKGIRHLLIVDEDMIYQGAARRSLGRLTDSDVTLWRIPQLPEKAASKTSAQLTAPQTFTFEDMLQRPAVSLDLAPVERFLKGRRVLVTGAGGSIGSELCRQIARLGCAQLTCLDNGEFNLYRIDEELGRTQPNLVRAAVLCDVRDTQALNAAFARHRPEIVFHAAALKHVPLVEDNVAAGVVTNVFGTRNTHEAAAANGARLFVLISTDKAVDPSSAMGATKRLAETVVRTQIDAVDSQMKTMAVRFGNVLGSAGSVIPLFRDQIERGGPITLTHPDVERYFMTIPEAVTLVLNAAMLGNRSNEQSVQTCILDMGAPVRIKDLAAQVCALYGKQLEVDIPLKIIGLRPGEKLSESLVDDGEQALPSPVTGIRVIESATVNGRLLSKILSNLEAAAHASDEDRCRELLFKLVAVSRGVPAVEPELIASV